MYLWAFVQPISGNDDEDLRGAYVVVYKDKGFRGESERFPVGEYKKLKGEWDDEIESIALIGPVRVTLFEGSAGF